MGGMIFPRAIARDVSYIGSPVASVPITNSIPTATVITPSWTAVTYAGTWVDSAASGYSGSQYWKDAAGIVHVIVSAKSGTNGTVIFTLPTGFRPVASNIIGAYIDTGTINYCRVQSDGQVIPSSGGNTLVLCFFHFPAVG